MTFNGDVVKKSVCYDEINVHDKKEFEQKSGNRTLCMKFSGGKTNPPVRRPCKIYINWSDLKNK